MRWEQRVDVFPEDWILASVRSPCAHGQVQYGDGIAALSNMQAYDDCIVPSIREAYHGHVDGTCATRSARLHSFTSLELLISKSFQKPLACFSAILSTPLHPPQ